MIQHKWRRRFGFLNSPPVWWEGISLQKNQSDSWALVTHSGLLDWTWVHTVPHSFIFTTSRRIVLAAVTTLTQKLLDFRHIRVHARRTCVQNNCICLRFLIPAAVLTRELRNSVNSLKRQELGQDVSQCTWANTLYNIYHEKLAGCKFFRDVVSGHRNMEVNKRLRQRFDKFSLYQGLPITFSTFCVVRVVMRHNVYYICVSFL